MTSTTINVQSWPETLNGIGTELMQRGEERLSRLATIMADLTRKNTPLRLPRELIRSNENLNSRQTAALVAEFETMLTAWPEATKTLLAFASDFPERSLDLFELATAINPCFTPSTIPLYLQGIHARRIDETVAAVDRACTRSHADIVSLLHTTPISRLAEVYLDREARRGEPAIFLTTMPKSGSMYLVKTIQHTTGLCILSTCIASNMARDHLVPSWARAFSQGGAVCQEHMHASEENIDGLRAAGIQRVVVHVRDPRQALLSAIHHLQSREAELRSLFGSSVLPPPTVRTFSQRTQWMLEHHLPELIDWISGWLAVERDPDQPIDILFTQYDQLTTNKRNLFDMIFSFYGITPKEHLYPEKNAAVHFRRGDPHEWRSVFSHHQIMTMNQQIPRQIMERFGWAP